MLLNTTIIKPTTRLFAGYQGVMRNKTMKKTLFLIITIVSQSAYAFDYKSYKEVSFEKAINTHKEAVGSSVDIAISAAVFKYKSKVIFTNKFRKITDKRKQFLQYWAKALRQHEFIKNYKSEILIKNGEKEMWVPMQDQVIPFMSKEIEIDEKFYLYHLFAGSNMGKWVFLGTEFRVK